MQRLFILITLAFLWCSQATAQDWVRRMEAGDNFYDVQKSFNEYWQSRTPAKGQGYKQFKRWEWFMEPRVYPSGRPVNPSMAWREAMKFRKTYHPSSGIRSAGNWTALGPKSWTSTGWNPGLGRVNCVAVDPNNSQVMYVGVPSGGCWKSIDGGSSWSATTDDLPILGVSSIAIDPSNSNTVYIGTGDGDGADTYSIGVLKSTNGGASWDTTGLDWDISQARRIYKLIINPDDPSIIYAATDNGLFRSDDSGLNWTQVLNDIIYDAVFKPGDPTTVYACSQEFYKSTDNGLNFTQTTNGTPSSGLINRSKIAVTPADPANVYLVCGDDQDATFYGLYRSADAGDSFTQMSNSPNIFGYSQSGSDNSGQSWYDLDIAASLSNANTIYVGGVNVWKSTDGGANWSIISHWTWPSSVGYTHADIHVLETFSNGLFCGSDGGIFKSTNAGASWTDISSGLQIMQFYRISCSDTDPTMVIGGAQDNGTNLKNGNNWTHVIGADGMEALIDYSNVQIMYGTTQNGSINRSTDGGASFTGITGSITESGAWVTPYVIDPSDPQILYAGYENVWKTTDRGNNWTAISTWGSGTLRNLAVAPSNNQFIYAGTGGSMHMTTDGGNLWQDISSSLPSGSVSYIAVDDQNPAKLWITVSGFTNGEKVFESIDAGQSWTNISGNLPNLPANCIVHEAGSTDGLYVGMDVGVYYKDDNLSNWQYFSDGLPNVIVDEMEIQYSSGKLRAGTFGRGLWESDLYQPITTPPVAQFTADQTSICPGQSVSFADNSINAAPGWSWSFPGGTPSSSSQQNPVVTYNTTGSYTVTLTVSNPYGSDASTITGYITVAAPQGSGSQIAEGFESTWLPSGWQTEDPDMNGTWQSSGSAGGFGQSSFSALMDNYNPNTQGLNDYLVTPAVDLGNSTQGVLRFHTAYAQYSNFYSDTLALYYSTDCGMTMNLLWEKGGSVLATASATTSAFVPAASEWRKDSADLSSALGNGAVRFYFENRGGWGNMLYLDNINIDADSLWAVGVSRVARKDIALYPNPATGGIWIEIQEIGHTAEIYDASGRFVKEFSLDSRLNHLNISTLSPGYYLLSIRGTGLRAPFIKMLGNR